MKPEELPVFPAADRNKSFILEELIKRIPERTRLIEIASGTGQHAQFFAENCPQWEIQTSDRELESMGLKNRVVSAGLENLLTPIEIDVTEELPRDLKAFDFLYAANCLHIMPWSAAPHFFEKVCCLLTPGGQAFLYGPFEFDDIRTAPSNIEFSASLRLKDPDMGLRHFNQILEESAKHSLCFQERISMPANNFILIFKKEN